jgi:hypothetical protein
MEDGYNVADYLLEIASDGIKPPAATATGHGTINKAAGLRLRGVYERNSAEESERSGTPGSAAVSSQGRGRKRGRGSKYAATFLTQVEVLCGREWKNLKRCVFNLIRLRTALIKGLCRDKTLFFMHLAVACVLGLFTGGLYFHVKTTISGFQNRVGSLFFLVSSRYLIYPNSTNNNS